MESSTDESLVTVVADITATFWFPESAESTATTSKGPVTAAPMLVAVGMLVETRT